MGGSVLPQRCGRGSWSLQPRHSAAICGGPCSSRCGIPEGNAVTQKPPAAVHCCTMAVLRLGRKSVTVKTQHEAQQRDKKRTGNRGVCRGGNQPNQLAEGQLCRSLPIVSSIQLLKAQPVDWGGCASGWDPRGRAGAWHLPARKCFGQHNDISASARLKATSHRQPLTTNRENRWPLNVSFQCGCAGISARLYKTWVMVRGMGCGHFQLQGRGVGFRGNGNLPREMHLRAALTPRPSQPLTGQRKVPPLGGLIGDPFDVHQARCGVRLRRLGRSNPQHLSPRRRGYAQVRA